MYKRTPLERDGIGNGTKNGKAGSLDFGGSGVRRGKVRFMMASGAVSLGLGWDGRQFGMRRVSGSVGEVEMAGTAGKRVRTIEDSLGELELWILEGQGRGQGNKMCVPRSMAIVPRWVDVPEGSRFFVIKSCSLEHVQKSFHNGIWSSTYFGNRRLCDAFDELGADARLFLFFSVNGSGRFCGVAEMVSGLKGNLDTSIWDDDVMNKKFGKAFVVRWIVVRDVHNKLLKHFLIPSNEMKPVTNSRDTQEIPFSIGSSILKIFKNEPADSIGFLDPGYT